MSVIANEQIDYSVKTNDIRPKYRYTKVFANIADPTISTQRIEAIFELPVACFNLGRSSLKFTSTIAADAGGKRSWFFADTIASVAEIKLYNRNNVYLCDCRYVDKKSSVTLKSEMHESDAEYRDSLTHGTNAGTSNNSYGVLSGNVISLDATVGNNVRPDGTIANMNPLEPLYLTTHATGPEAKNHDLKLSLFDNTILAMDKDFFFAEKMYLKVVFNPRNHWGFLSDADIAAPQTMTGDANIVNSVGVTKLALYLALEEDPNICMTLENKVQSGGLVTAIPYVHTFDEVRTAAYDHRISLTLGPQHGRHLKRIYHVPFHATESVSTRYTHSNLNATDITRYYTNVDKKRRQEFDVTIADQDDWLMVKDFLKGKVLNRMEMYRYNYFILDNYDSVEDNGIFVDSGLPLIKDTTFDVILATNNKAYHYYSFAIVTKILSITASGVTVG